MTYQSFCYYFTSLILGYFAIGLVVSTWLGFLFHLDSQRRASLENQPYTRKEKYGHRIFVFFLTPIWPIILMLYVSGIIREKRGHV